MNIIALIFAVLVLIASLFWFFSKKGVWERGISVLTSVSSVIVIVWQLNGTPMAEKPLPIISAEGNVNSPITGYVEHQTNNYYPTPPQNNTKENPSKAENKGNPASRNDRELLFTVSLVVNSTWSDAQIFVDNKTIFPTNNTPSIKTIEIPSGKHTFKLIKGLDTCTVLQTIKASQSKVIFTCQ